jgi:hypothetical protein
MEFLEVIDLTVEYNTNISILIELRLRTSLNIDNRQPTMSESNSKCASIILSVHAPAVRPAVRKGVGHPIEQISR